MNYSQLDGPSVTKEDREEAVLFYYSSANDVEKSWIDNGLCEDVIDHRCVSLSKLLASYRNVSEMRGFLVGISTIMKGTNGVENT